MIENMELSTGFIEVVCRESSKGRSVDIYSPWTGEDPDYCDITIDDIGGDLGMACTGEEDYYCAVSSHDARVFAWEIQLACSICDNWERFWRNPEYFCQKMRCPVGNFPVVVAEA